VDVKAVAAGTRASKLIGGEVLNADGESIGDVEDFIIDQKSVLFAMQVGGFLGLGGLLVAVPYDRLEIGADVDRAGEEARSGVPSGAEASGEARDPPWSARSRRTRRHG
jgi:hypothetical protein